MELVGGASTRLTAQFCPDRQTVRVPIRSWPRLGGVSFRPRCPGLVASSVIRSQEKKEAGGRLTGSWSHGADLDSYGLSTWSTSLAAWLAIFTGAAYPQLLPFPNTANPEKRSTFTPERLAPKKGMLITHCTADMSLDKEHHGALRRGQTDSMSRTLSGRLGRLHFLRPRYNASFSLLSSLASTSILSMPRSLSGPCRHWVYCLKSSEHSLFSKVPIPLRYSISR